MIYRMLQSKDVSVAELESIHSFHRLFLCNLWMAFAFLSDVAIFKFLPCPQRHSSQTGAEQE